MVMVMRPELLQAAAERNLGVLATIKRDGRPQMSHVGFVLDLEQGALRISVTDDRAKVRNLRRDPRASMFVSGRDGWSYAVLEGTVQLSAVAQAPNDPVVGSLIQLYRDVQGQEHPDWDDYRAAMVGDKRLIATLRVEHTYGITS